MACPQSYGVFVVVRGWQYARLHDYAELRHDRAVLAIHGRRPLKAFAVEQRP